MRVLRIVLLACIPLALIVAVLAPIGPLPGFFIGGTATATPASWPDTSDVDEIRLKVPGGIPRVVIIWVIQVDSELYVVGAKDSGWVTKIGAGSPVEVRLGDETYALTAAPVSQGWERVLEAYKAKYEPDYPDIVADFPSMEEAADFAAVFRLSRG